MSRKKIVVYYESIKQVLKINLYMSVGVMKDYKLKLRNLYVTHTLVGRGLLQRARFPVKQRRREAAIGEEEEVKQKKNREKQEEKLWRGRECKCKCRQSPDSEFSCHELSLCATTPLQM
jgi:hypothetical protein